MKISILTRKITAAAIMVSITVLAGCAKKEKKGDILAIVGDRVITADEFIRRAEYTIRPSYCRLNSNIDKKIMLNSIIAEKLYAFEAGENNPLSRRPAFRAFIRGIQEQIMRQQLYEEIIKGKTGPDTSEFNERYRLAGREYHLAYFTSDRKGAQIVTMQKNNPSAAGYFDELYRHSGGLGSPPERSVSWNSQELPAVHQALFSRPLKKGQVVGPIRTGSDKFLIVQIIGWIDRPAVSDEAVRQRSQEVTEEIEQEKGQALWNDYIYKIMKNKRLDFRKAPFEKMVDLFRPMYMASGENWRLSALNLAQNTDNPKTLTLDSIFAGIQEGGFRDQPFFDFDGKTWTVADFIRLHASHPLVFRKGKMSPNEFPEQFKYAIADMVRDGIVNQKAYEKGLEKSSVVVAYTNMWRDALTADFQRYAYLKSKGADADSVLYFMLHIEKYLNAYTDSLFIKYSSQIRINIPIYEKIKLTRIDMIALNRDVSYPKAVPDFPLLTNSIHLNYGRRME
jgi:hypothetical protein